MEVVYKGASSKGQWLESWNVVEGMVVFYGNVLDGESLYPILVLFFPMIKVKVLIAGGYF